MVDPYLIDCVMEGAVAVPVSYRERVRALGPTIHPDMGKQAQGGEAVRVLQAAHRLRPLHRPPQPDRA